MQPSQSGRAGRMSLLRSRSSSPRAIRAAWLFAVEKLRFSVFSRICTGKSATKRSTTATESSAEALSTTISSIGRYAVDAISGSSLRRWDAPLRLRTMIETSGPLSTPAAGPAAMVARSLSSASGVARSTLRRPGRSGSRSPSNGILAATDRVRRVAPRTTAVTARAIRTDRLELSRR